VSNWSSSEHRSEVFRFFVALAEGFVVLFVGFAAGELGGRRDVQLAAALAVAIQGPSLFAGSFMS
jgi:Flp pilus assembly protein protease CpaA